MEILLTIAIPTIESRQHCFDKLVEELKKQSKPYGNQIEIISLCDNKEMTIGEKRNKLNAMANGKYVVQWDDDDWICEDGIDLIMEGIKMDTDCVTYDAPCIKPPLDENRTFSYSIKNYYSYTKKNDTFYLSADQKCVIKKEILDKVKFKEIRYQEDLQFLYDIHPHLKTEHRIEKNIYFNLNLSGDSLFDFNKRYGIITNKLI
jgi:glycosyltransferase involved in cell wall biosynthesis